MIRHVWSVACRKSVIDKESNNISFYDVVEQVNLTPPPKTEFPTVIPFEHELVSLWSRGEDDPEEGLYRLRWVGPDGTVQHELTQDIDVTQHQRMRTRARSNGFHIAGEGEHHWEVALQTNEGWNIVARVPIQVVLTIAE